ncbi:HK97 gp10 family phage protein [Paenibacillus sp. P96]|uniref:HK97 gp10 family phage protein n=1 Tax=Paenibacillus zeirhizosphaerae TaxID=2987519 RepID=A0ABT9FLQ6_9BACL|nr:HK97-gp10 family putative phage morphogenesis protein [Paenibacillus sp. P96]MDP4095471.1 HK97 gp10 family phage protein [Paenibacillus sp. P96]
MARRRYTNSRFITLDVSGFEDYLQNIAAAGKNVDDAVKTALVESAKPIQEDIKAWAEKHKLTGTTLAGVDLAEPVQNGNEITVAVGINDEKSPGAWHATFVEHGTPNQPADPGIRTAFERNKSKVKKIQRDVLKREGMPLD